MKFLFFFESVLFDAELKDFIQIRFLSQPNFDSVWFFKPFLKKWFMVATVLNSRHIYTFVERTELSLNLSENNQ